jgi:hypothetical protein
MLSNAVSVERTLEIAVADQILCGCVRLPLPAGEQKKS